MNLKHLLLLVACSLLSTLYSCDDDDQAQSEFMKEQVTAMEPSVNQLNTSILCYQNLISGELPVGVIPVEKGYKVELSGGGTYEVGSGEEVDAFMPLITISKDGNWSYSFDGTNYITFTDVSGKALNAYSLEGIEAIYRSPQLKIDSDGFWKVTCDGGATYSYLSNSSQKKVAAFGSKGVGLTSLFDNVVYNEAANELALTMKAEKKQVMFPVITTFYLKVKGSETEDDRTFFLGETRKYEVEASDVTKTKIVAPKGWEVTLQEGELSIKAPASAAASKTQSINLVITSSKQYLRTVTLDVKLLNMTFDESYCTAWKEFVAGSENNVLLDFSYAGYMHGEVAPPDVYSLGYQVYNVMDYGAVPDDDKSDREAFLKALEAAGAKRSNSTGTNAKTVRMQLGSGKLNAIIYFPPGKYILQDDKEINESIHLTMGNFIIKGAGRGLTTIKMDAKNKLVTPGSLWTCPTMIEIKHYTGVKDEIAKVTGDAAKGSFEVAVSSASKIKAGDWVCLYLMNNDPELVAKEIAPHPVSDLNANVSIIKDGVEVFDLHQVASVNDNKVTFVEPIMHEVEAKYNWVIKDYQHYENVGVEDLTFEGKAKDKFFHHGEGDDGSGSDDSEYKLIDFSRLVNSWMRRVNFVSVSEAASMVSCANVSVYDVDISGNRGHSAVRSNSSSRVFIGKVTDHSHGYRIVGNSVSGEWMDNAGQYHGCGVSKPSMGAVIWNVRWGEDGCYESHASQPRATLIDRCEGAFIPSRQGGDELEVPNHLNDLIIWNMNATRVGYENSWNNKFVWWDKSSRWGKTMPPTIIGFHGASINFAETFISDVPQNKRIESQGTRVEPYSLYEAQLRRRLGYVPAWLSGLK